MMDQIARPENERPKTMVETVTKLHVVLMLLLVSFAIFGDFVAGGYRQTTRLVSRNEWFSTCDSSGTHMSHVSAMLCYMEVI